MKCPNCGHELADNVRFCVNCGTKIETAQPKPAQPVQQPQPEQKPAQQSRPASVPELTLNHSSSYRPEQSAQSAQQPSQPKPVQPSSAAGTAAGAAAGAAVGAAVAGTAAAGQMPSAHAQNPRPVQQPQPVQNAQPIQPAQAVQPQQTYAQPVQTYQQRPVQQVQPAYETDERSKPYGTGGWMLVQFLEGLPLIGFICQLVWAFGSGNISRRNYARARLIWLLIGIALSVLFGVLFSREFGGVISRIKNIIDNYGVEALLNGLKDPLV